MIKIKDFIKKLGELDQEQNIKVACDEEWNTIFCDTGIEQDGKHGAYVMFGLSGSEEESYQDVVDEKFDRRIEKTFDCEGCGATQQTHEGLCDSCKGIPDDKR